MTVPAFEVRANYQLSRPISGHLATFACPRFRQSGVCGGGEEASLNATSAFPRRRHAF
jgi:hypothetical protein